MDLDKRSRQGVLLALETIHHCEGRGRSNEWVATRWRQTSVALSIAAALLAGASGASVPGAADGVVASLALAAGIVAAVTAALNPAGRAQKHAEAAVAYRHLRSRVVTWLSLDVFLSETELLPIQDEGQYAALHDQVVRFREEQAALEAVSPAVSVRPEFNPRDEAYIGTRPWRVTEQALQRPAASGGCRD